MKVTELLDLPYSQLIEADEKSQAQELDFPDMPEVSEEQTVTRDCELLDLEEDEAEKELELRDSEEDTLEKIGSSSSESEGEPGKKEGESTPEQKQAARKTKNLFKLLAG